VPFSCSMLSETGLCEWQFDFCYFT